LAWFEYREARPWFYALEGEWEARGLGKLGAGWVALGDFPALALLPPGKPADDWVKQSGWVKHGVLILDWGGMGELAVGRWSPVLWKPMSGRLVLEGRRGFGWWEDETSVSAEERAAHVFTTEGELEAGRIWLSIPEHSWQVVLEKKGERYPPAPRPLRSLDLSAGSLEARQASTVAADQGEVRPAPTPTPTWEVPWWATPTPLPVYDRVFP
jgi:hypothetical protein